MPSDNFMKLGNAIHRSLIKVSSGKRGWDMAGMPVVKLTTMGRKSGKSRTVMLTSPIQFKNSIVLVASKGGSDSHPDWYLNLRKNSIVKVETHLGTNSMNAKVVESSEREKLWSEITKDYPNYASYQEKTDRVIPIVILEMKSSSKYFDVQEESL